MKLFVCFAFLTLLTSSTSVRASTYSNAVLSDSPVLYFRLGDASGSTIARDASLSANHGSYSGSVTPGVPGLIANDSDTAANFSGGHVSIPDAANINFVNKPYSIEAWIDPSSLGYYLRIFDKVGASTPDGYGLDMTSSAIRMTGSVNLQALFTFQTSQIYYVVATSDGSGNGSIYVNGNLVNSGTYFSSNPFTQPASIGDSGDSGCCAFQGVIDELAIYNQSLSTQQIGAHYRDGIAITTPEPSMFLPLGFWVVGLGLVRVRSKCVARRLAPESR